MLAQGAMYKAVNQSVLLYFSKSWLVTGEMLKILAAFHHRVARRITGITVKLRSGIEWEYPSVEEEMEAAVLHPIRVYIKRR